MSNENKQIDNQAKVPAPDTLQEKGAFNEFLIATGGGATGEVIVQGGRAVYQRVADRISKPQDPSPPQQPPSDPPPPELSE